MRSVLTGALADDPAFAMRLETAATQNTLHAGRDVTVQTVSVSSSTVKGTINIGPLTITKSRGAYLALIAAVIVLASLLALGAYGTVQAISINDSPATRPTESTTAPEAEKEPELEPIRTRNVAKVVMPDQSALPAGWSANEPYWEEDPLSGSIELTGPEYGITLDMDFFGTAASASKQLNRSDILSAWDIDQGSVKSLAMPKIGDESMALIDHAPSGGQVGMVAAARVGTVVCQLASWGTPKPADHADEVLAFTRMCIQRARQGQQGRTPDAVVESG